MKAQLQMIPQSYHLSSNMALFPNPTNRRAMIEVKTINHRITINQVKVQTKSDLK